MIIPMLSSTELQELGLFINFGQILHSEQYNYKTAIVGYHLHTAPSDIRPKIT